MANTKIQSEQIADDVALAGSPTTTTQSASDNSTKVATTAYVTTAVANLVDSAPSSLNTLNELAAAMNDNASFFSTVLPLSGGTMTGNIAHASDFTIDAGGDITLDADGADIILKDGGTSFAEFDKDNDNFRIKNPIADGDIKIQGVDGSSTITALDFDMSAAGAATFNSEVFIPEKLTHTGDTDTHFKFAGANDIRIVAGNVEHAAFDGTIVFNQSGADMNARFESTGNENMLFVDAGNDRIGIGTNAPTSPLTVAMDAGGVATFTGISSGGVSSVLMKQSRGSIASPSNSSTAGDGNYILSQVYNSGYATIGSIGIITGSALNNGEIQFNTAISGTVAERMRLSGGNLALMTDGAEFKLYYTEPRKLISNSGPSVTIKQIDNHATNAYIDFAAWDNSSLMRLMNDGKVGINRTSPNGLLHIQSDAGSNAQLYVQTGDTSTKSQLIFGDSGDSNTGGVQYDHSDDSLQFHVGNVGEKMRLSSVGHLILKKNLVLESTSEGIDFSGVGSSAQTLDDYEEGVWTVRLTDASANDCGYQSRTGHYTKIGNLVYVIFAIEINSKSGVGNALQIRGLPFTVENVSAGGGEPSGGSLTFANNLTSRDLGGGIILRANNATDYIEMKYTAGGAQTGIGATNFNATDIGASTYMTGFCMYRT